MKATKIAAIPVGLGLLIVGAAFWLSGIGGSEHLRAAELGGDYLVRALNTDGSFVYEYDPIEQRESSSYNILRHAGTTYSLLELYEASGKKRYLVAAESALDYLVRQIVACPFEGLCVLEDDEIKLGGNGLALLALIKHAALTDSNEYSSIMQGLAEAIVAVQSIQGEFTVHKMDAAGVPDDFVSGYYPGEAIFALARFSALTGDEHMMEAAHAGARWLIEVRDAGVPIEKLNHDHWLLYALRELYAHTPDPLYLEQTRKIVDAISTIQHRNQTGARALWNGGFYNPPRSTPTATRSEGLTAAHAIFEAAGDETYADLALETLEAAIEFQLRTQFTREKIKTLGADPRALGAFHESLTEYAVRIDYVQHNISALLGFDAIQKEE